MASEDREIQAMSQVAAALADLDDDARSRVLDWAAKRYKVALAPARGGANEARPRRSGRSSADGGPDEADREFSVFADLFDATNPKQESERALIGGFWFQEILKQPDFAGQSVNNALKDVGHGISNITVALGTLQKRKPALVRQVAKSGRSKQARKKYKLTSAGVAAVYAMMNGGAAAEDAE
jgi:hypothetical protein